MLTGGRLGQQHALQAAVAVPLGRGYWWSLLASTQTCRRLGVSSSIGGGWVAHSDEAIGADVFDQDGFGERGSAPVVLIDLIGPWPLTTSAKHHAFSTSLWLQGPLPTGVESPI